VSATRPPPPARVWINGFTLPDEPDVLLTAHLSHESGEKGYYDAMLSHAFGIDCAFGGVVYVPEARVPTHAQDLHAADLLLHARQLEERALERQTQATRAAETASFARQRLAAYASARFSPHVIVGTSRLRLLKEDLEKTIRSYDQAAMGYEAEALTDLAQASDCRRWADVGDAP